MAAADLELFTIAEAAAKAKLSRRTIERRIADGSLPAIRLPAVTAKARGGSIRIAGPDLERFLHGLPPDRPSALGRLASLPVLLMF